MTRAAVVKEALSWVGTPYHDSSCVKGAGVDCLNFLIGVYSAPDVAMIEKFKPEPYKPQWFLHREEPLFLQGLARYAHQVDAPLPGDIAMYNFGRHAAHGAIIIDDYAIVHAFMPLRCVNKDSRQVYHTKLHSYWSLFP